MKTQGTGHESRGLSAGIAGGFVVLGSLAWGAQTLAAKTKEHPILSIITENYAEVPDRTLEEAEVVATRVFSIAGVDTRWHQCGKNEVDCIGGSNPSNLETGASVFLLIIPRAMAARLASRADSIGFAILPGAGQTGNRAYISYNRVEELAAAGDASAGQLLGDAMAHEIGHLLLNSDAHSAFGIMQADWGSGQMALLRVGQLLFTGSQPLQMRDAVIARLTETRSVQAQTSK